MLFYDNINFTEYSYKTFHSKKAIYENNTLVHNILDKGFSIPLLCEVDLSQHNSTYDSVITDEELSTFSGHYWKLLEVEAIRKVYKGADNHFIKTVDDWTSSYFELLSVKNLFDILYNALIHKTINFDSIVSNYSLELALNLFILSKADKFTYDDYLFFKANRGRYSDETMDKHLSALLQGVNDGYSALNSFKMVYEKIFISYGKVSQALFGLDSNLNAMKDVKTVRNYLYKYTALRLDDSKLYGSFDKSKFEYITVFEKDIKIYKPLEPIFMVYHNGLYIEVDLDAGDHRALHYDSDLISYSDSNIQCLSSFQDYLWKDILDFMLALSSNMNDLVSALSVSKFNIIYNNLFLKIDMLKNSNMQMTKVTSMLLNNDTNNANESIGGNLDKFSAFYDKFSSVTEDIDILNISLKSLSSLKAELVANVDDIDDIDKTLETVAVNESIIYKKLEATNKALVELDSDKSALADLHSQLSNVQSYKSGNPLASISANKKLLHNLKSIKNKMEQGSSDSRCVSDMQNSCSSFNSSCAGVEVPKNDSLLSSLTSSLGLSGFSLPELPSLDTKAMSTLIDNPFESRNVECLSCKFDLTDSNGLGFLMAGIGSLMAGINSIIKAIGIIIQGILNIIASIWCAILKAIDMLLKFIECLLNIVIAGVQLVASFTKKIIDWFNSDTKLEIRPILTSIKDEVKAVIEKVVDIVTKPFIAVADKINQYTPLEDIKEILNGMFDNSILESIKETSLNIFRALGGGGADELIDKAIKEIESKMYEANQKLNNIKMAKLFQDLKAKGWSDKDIAILMDKVQNRLKECDSCLTSDEKEDIEKRLLSKIRGKLSPMQKAKDCLPSMSSSSSGGFKFNLPTLKLPSFNTGC